MAAQGLSVFLSSPSSSAPTQSCRKRFGEQPLTLNLHNFFVGTKLKIPAFSLVLSARRGSGIANVFCSLPITKKEPVASDKAPKWSARAIKSFAMAELEARKLKYPNSGTESLLMGILVEGTSLAAKFLRENGINFLNVRDETVNLLGKSDVCFSSPERPPLTKPAQRAIDWAFEEKLKSGESGEITTSYLLLGIWSQKEYAGHRILSTLGFTDEKAQELAKNRDKDIVLSFK